MIVYQEMTEANAEEQCTVGLEFTSSDTFGSWAVSFLFFQQFLLLNRDYYFIS